MHLSLPQIVKQIPVSKLILILFSFVLQYSYAAAQIISQPLAFNALTINDGLSQGMVVRIFQDRYGFMWFATLDGLNRYDGYKFNVFRHDPQDSSSITKSFVQSIFEDSKGRLWIGTVSGGLDLFDRETETFIHIKKQEGRANGLADGSIKSIAEDNQGNLWVHISDKLDKITINNSDKKHNSKKISIHHVKLPFQSDKSFLSITTSGKIYYVNAGKGIVYKLEDAKTEKWSVLMKVSDTLQNETVRVANVFNIVQLVEDTMTQKLFVIHKEGVTRFNEKTSKLETTFHNNFFHNFDTPLRSNLDKSGILWFAGHNDLLLFDTHTGELQRATATTINASRLLQSAYSIYVDRSGLLWLGTAGYGLLKRNVRSEYFHHTGDGADYAIREADNGKILFGNNVKVHQLFDRKTRQVTATTGMNKGELKYLNKFLFLPVATDKDGSWFADGNTLHYKNHISKQEIDYPLPVARNNEYVELIQSKIKDSGAHIWLGTTTGLLRFNVADKKWTVFKNIPNDPGSISSNVIFTLCLDPLQPTKYLWIGTGGGGINRMDLVTGKCKTYSIKDGLPNNVIYGILNDDAGNLWMSTNQGLSCFNVKTRTFRNFDHKDGLQSNEFNRGAYCRTKDGWLFFGGVNGFNYFYPKEISNNTTVPQVIITGLKIRNENVTVQDERSPLLKVIYMTQKLILPYEQNFVSLQFAALDFTYPEKNRYRYKLKGFDKSWISSGTVNTATYSNIDPGTYTFYVQGSNNDGIWNNKGASIQLIILPPWYMTWWFRASLLAAFLLMVYTLYKYRLTQALKLQAIRDRIAGDLHDEVGSNLSNIYIFSNVAQHKANVETAQLLQKINDYTRQSMDAMTDIVWMINTRNDRFENIMVRMRTLAVESSEICDCKLHLTFDERLNEVQLNMEKRKNFYLIYKEAMNNMVKYAGCKTMWIDMKLHQKKLTLTIKDNGKGFDMVASNKGNGLYNMNKRAELLHGDLKVTSSPGAGTTLQLSFKV